MNPQQIQTLLASVADQSMSIEQAMAQLRKLPFEQLPYATIDHHRAIRCGHPEVIFCQNKTALQVVEIAHRLADAGSVVFGTRANLEQFASIQSAFPDVLINPSGRAFLIHAPAIVAAEKEKPYIALISAGTADTPIVEEAAMTLQSMSVPFRRLNDVGVSGLHRLLAQLDVLQQACAVIVIAGMEGALPSVVGGLCAVPVYAVPTSVGYGANLGGLSAMLGMLNSCASNVSVVNIDNGFGAAFCASLLYKQVMKN